MSTDLLMCNTTLKIKQMSVWAHTHKHTHTHTQWIQWCKDIFSLFCATYSVRTTWCDSHRHTLVYTRWHTLYSACSDCRMPELENLLLYWNLCTKSLYRDTHYNIIHSLNPVNGFGKSPSWSWFEVRTFKRKENQNHFHKPRCIIHREIKTYQYDYHLLHICLPSLDREIWTHQPLTIEICFSVWRSMGMLWVWILGSCLQWL